MLLSGVFFAFKVARLLRVEARDVDGVHVWTVSGQVFFASADAFLEAFDPREVAGRQVRIDVSRARFWDITAVAALDAAMQRLRHQGLEVRLSGLDAGSRRLLQRVGAAGGFEPAL